LILKKWYISFIFLAGLVSCGKEDSSYIPSVSVNFQAPLTDPRLNKLGSPGSAVAISGYGVAGLIIYRTTGGGYVAYDRCSSYQPEKRCAVTLDDTNLTATDPCSGSKFLLSDGSPVKAPATRSLRTYFVTVSNFNLIVSN
jgi:nitrite reductase/ring-hydroxylating ferredoxin subunit